MQRSSTPPRGLRHRQLCRPLRIMDYTGRNDLDIMRVLKMGQLTQPKEIIAELAGVENRLLNRGIKLFLVLTVILFTAYSSMARADSLSNAGYTGAMIHTGAISSLEVRGGAGTSWESLRWKMLEQLKDRCSGSFNLIESRRGEMGSLPGRLDARMMIAKYSCLSGDEQAPRIIISQS